MYDHQRTGKKYYAIVNVGTVFNWGIDLESAIKYGEITRINNTNFNTSKASTVTIIQNKGSVADELKKLKELLDAGAITKAEFEDQKKKILQ
jgi:hypothetical protein